MMIEQTSVNKERVFSLANLILSCIRMRLGQENFNNIYLLIEIKNKIFLSLFIWVSVSLGKSLGSRSYLSFQVSGLGKSKYESRFFEPYSRPTRNYIHRSNRKRFSNFLLTKARTRTHPPYMRTSEISKGHFGGCVF